MDIIFYALITLPLRVEEPHERPFSEERALKHVLLIVARTEGVEFDEVR